MALAMAGAPPEPVTLEYEGLLCMRIAACLVVLIFQLLFQPYRSEKSMSRVIELVVAASLLAIHLGSPTEPAPASTPVNVATLLGAARGAPPIICALAAQTVLNDGWREGGEAPVTPLPAVDLSEDHHGRWRQLATADEDQLLTGLGSDDACVRELSVRVLGRDDSPRVADALVGRLGAPDASLRAVAAFGLGLVQPGAAVDPLIHALGDGTPAVRANSAWALGRIENGRALAPLERVFRDDDAVVREAAVGAVGRLDSTSAVASLTRVLQQDASPQVRRVAAWALGTLEARPGAGALATALGHDADRSVREMSAWALGSIEGEDGGTALIAALQHDDDDHVREMAAWALAQNEDHGAADALGAAAEGDHSSTVRGTAAWAIGQLELHSPRAMAGLEHVLMDQSEDARLKAAWALGQVGDSTALPAIRGALAAEHSDEVRRALIRALVKSGGRSERTLTALLESSDATVREAAVRGLAGNDAFWPWPWPEPRPRPFP